MNSIFLVSHCYGADGGFGDAIPQEECIMAFSERIEAERFVKTFEDPHVYEKPYDELSCGTLKINEIQIVDYKQASLLLAGDKEKYWWKRTLPY